MNKISPGIASSIQSSLQAFYKKTVLSTGLRVVTEEIPYVHSASFGVWINVGSRDEHVRNNGISHFLEHMVFKGTKHYSLQQIARSLESVGGYVNAFTSKEHTCYYARCLDTHFPKAVSVIADFIRYPMFERKEIRKEKFVVLEELKNIEDDPDDLIHDVMDQQVYHKHPLSFPVIGQADNIKKITREELFEYSHAHYIPEQMVVAAAGNIKHNAVVQLVQKYFGTSSTHNGHHPRTNGPKSHHPKTQIVEKPISQAHVCLGTVAYGVKSKQRYPLLVMNTLLGEGMSSRLFQTLREKHGIAYNVYSFVNTMSDTGNFGVYLAADEHKVDTSIDLIYREFEKLQKASVSKAELKRTKSQLKGTMMLSLESMSSRMMRLGGGEMYYGNFLSLDEVVRNIDAVNAEDVCDVANKLLPQENFSVIIFKPRKEESKKQLHR